MIDVDKTKKGDLVHYQPEHYKKDDRYENGIVKRVSSGGVIFVVYNCNEQWDDFENYTAANTSPIDLYLGWKGVVMASDVNCDTCDYGACDDCIIRLDEIEEELLSNQITE